MYFPIRVSASVIVANQELVCEYGGQQLRLVVGQATMPHAVSQFKMVLKPFVERLDRLAASFIQALTLGAEEERQTPFASLT